MIMVSPDAIHKIHYKLYWERALKIQIYIKTLEKYAIRITKYVDTKKILFNSPHMMGVINFNDSIKHKKLTIFNFSIFTLFKMTKYFKLIKASK